MMKIEGRKIGEIGLLLLMAVLFLSVFSHTTSPFFDAEGGDSAIFKYLGLGILHGKMPYVDLFDNKGPYLYLINALGQWLIPGRFGIFLLQIVSLTVSLCFIYLTLRYFVKPKKAILCEALSLFLLAGCYMGGNYVEEWKLPFISIGFYLAIGLFVKPHCLTERKTVALDSLVFGLCFGMVLMLRPNDAVGFFGGIMVGVVLWLLLRKEYRIMACSVLSFAGGAIITIAPIVIWYASKSSIMELWYGMFVINGKVANGMSGQLLSLLKWGKWAILLLMLTLCVLVLTTGNRKLLWLLVPMCALHLVLIGEKLYAHYFIPFFPLLSLYVAMLFCQRNKSVLILAVAILCLSHRPLPRTAVLNIFQSIKTMGTHANDERGRSPIPECEKDSVWNYSVDPWRPGIPLVWLVNHEVVQCNRNTVISDSFVEEIDFQLTNPKWVVSYGNEFEKDSCSAGYSLVDSVATKQYSIYFYRRQ